MLPANLPSKNLSPVFPPQNVPRPKILFIVSSFNNERFITESLLAIIDQKGDAQKKILVVDDGSSDKSVLKVQMLMYQYPEIKVLQQKHQGQASALNLGLEKAKDYDFIAFVEADVKIEKKWLQKNLPLFQRPAIMGVGGSLKPFPKDNWIARLAGREIEYKLIKQKHHPLHLTSASVIYRASIFKKVGYFRTDLKNSSFDVELNLRIKNVHGRLIYNPKAWAWHHYKPTLSAFLKRSYAYARFRPHLHDISLYPYDHIIKFQIILVSLTAPILLLTIILNSSLLFILFLICSISYFLLTLPPVIWTLKNRKDLVMLLYPAISILRNSVALLGLGVGILEYRRTLKHKKILYAKHFKEF